MGKCINCGRETLISNELCEDCKLKQSSQIDSLDNHIEQIIPINRRKKLWITNLVVIAITIPLIITLFLTLSSRNNNVNIITNPAPSNAQVINTTTPMMSEEDRKSKVRASLKNIEPKAYSDVGIGLIPYNDRRDKILSFINNLCDFLITEKDSSLLSDKDFEDAFGTRVKTQTYESVLGGKKINIRLIAYWESGEPNINKS